MDYVYRLPILGLVCFAFLRGGRGGTFGGLYYPFTHPLPPWLMASRSLSFIVHHIEGSLSLRTYIHTCLSRAGFEF